MKCPIASYSPIEPGQRIPFEDEWQEIGAVIEYDPETKTVTVWPADPLTN
jgi:hypothetical protein